MTLDLQLIILFLLFAIGPKFTKLNNRKGLVKVWVTTNVLFLIIKVNEYIKKLRRFSLPLFIYFGNPMTYPPI